MAKFSAGASRRIYFLTSVAAPTTGVTTAELTAGKNLSSDLAEVGGFQMSNSPISVPNLTDTFTPQIDGEDTVADSTLTLYDDDTATVNRTALLKGTVGYIVLVPYGATATKRCEIWPVKSTGVNDEWTTGNEPARYTVGFAVTAVPVQNAAIS